MVSKQVQGARQIGLKNNATVHMCKTKEINGQHRGARQGDHNKAQDKDKKIQFKVARQSCKTKHKTESNKLVTSDSTKVQEKSTLHIRAIGIEGAWHIPGHLIGSQKIQGARKMEI